jgi:hypothetical protein
MKGTRAVHRSPRCTATSKRTKQRCQAPAVTGWTVCRFHSARGGDPKGALNGGHTGTNCTRQKRWRGGGRSVNCCGGRGGWRRCQMVHCQNKSRARARRHRVMQPKAKLILVECVLRPGDEMGLQ